LFICFKVFIFEISDKTDKCLLAIYFGVHFIQSRYSLETCWPSGSKSVCFRLWSSLNLSLSTNERDNTTQLWKPTQPSSRQYTATHQFSQF